MVIMMCAFPMLTRALDLKGVVIDANDNEPLIGASVQLKNKPQGATTGFDGR